MKIVYAGEYGDFTLKLTIKNYTPKSMRVNDVESGGYREYWTEEDIFPMSEKEDILIDVNSVELLKSSEVDKISEMCRKFLEGKMDSDDGYHDFRFFESQIGLKFNCGGNKPLESQYVEFVFSPLLSICKVTNHHNICFRLDYDGVKNLLNAISNPVPDDFGDKDEYDSERNQEKILCYQDNLEGLKLYMGIHGYVRKSLRTNHGEYLHGYWTECDIRLDSAPEYKYEGLDLHYVQEYCEILTSEEIEEIVYHFSKFLKGDYDNDDYRLEFIEPDIQFKFDNGQCELIFALWDPQGTLSSNEIRVTLDKNNVKKFLNGFKDVQV